MAGPSPFSLRQLDGNSDSSLIDADDALKYQILNKKASMRNQTLDGVLQPKADPVGRHQAPQVGPFVAQLAVAELEARFDRSGNADLISNNP